MNEIDGVGSRLSDQLESKRRERGLPSLNAAVVMGSKLVWQDACGLADLESNRPATAEMVYPLGSISKVFIVTMLMQLVERGVVCLEDPVSRYVPEYQVLSPFASTPPTTLRQLASHTSGLPRDAAINFPMNRSLGAWEFSGGQAPLHWYAPTDAILRSLRTERLQIPPDTAKLYSNLGIMLLGVALERACGQDFHAYIAQNIFHPLGMTSAGFLDPAGAWDERFPMGYGRRMSDGSLFPAPRWQLGGAVYTGGIYATAADLARFCAAFLGQPSPLLGAASIQRMIHPAAMGDTHLGWWKGWHAGQSNFGHAGAHVGFISAGLFMPTHNLAVAVQTNRWNPVFDTGDSTEIARELIAELIPSAEKLRPPFDPAEVDLSIYEGIYRLPGEHASIEVTHAHESFGLRLILRSGPPEVMLVVPIAPHQFGPPGTSFTSVVFQADSSGVISSLNYALFQFYRDAPIVR